MMIRERAAAALRGIAPPTVYVSFTPDAPTTATPGTTETPTDPSTHVYESILYDEEYEKKNAIHRLDIKKEELKCHFFGLL